MIGAWKKAVLALFGREEKYDLIVFVPAEDSEPCVTKVSRAMDTVDVEAIRVCLDGQTDVPGEKPLTLGEVAYMRISARNEYTEEENVALALRDAKFWGLRYIPPGDIAGLRAANPALPMEEIRRIYADDVSGRDSGAWPRPDETRHEPSIFDAGMI